MTTASAPSTAHKVVNFLGFQAVWFALVMFAAADRPWVGIGIGAAWLALHVGFSDRRRREATTMAAVTVLGLVLDQPMVAWDVQNFPPQHATVGLVPVWIGMLWAAFAATFHSSFRWLHGRPLAAALMGGIFGPVAYTGAEALGAVVIGPGALAPEPGARERWSALAALSVEWAIALPLALAIAGAMARTASKGR